MTEKIKADSRKVVVKVDHVAKTFRLPKEHSSELKQHVINLVRGKKGYTDLEVLRDISLEVHEGDFFGIVGRNGSGKSTLLKLLAGIYQPTKGKITTVGKIVPFIELGVGFNPELTGRENIYLNGAMLGFSNDEVNEMYNEIVDFAELDEFMDQKLKNYSSGMQVRLAFSIAIKAQGDVLILDEVLAVGDEAFQTKCNDFFEKIRKDKHKTIILVTHDMGSVRKYCNKALMIRNGNVIADGTPNEVANQYTKENMQSDNDNNATDDETGFPLGLSAQIPKFKIKSQSDKILTSDQDLIFDIEYENDVDAAVETVVIEIDNASRSNTPVMLDTVKNLNHGRGQYKIQYKYSLKNINDGDYVVTSTLRNKKAEILAYTSDANSFRFAIRNINNSLSSWPLLREHGEVLHVVKE